MNRSLIVLAFAVTLAAGLWFLGVFERDGDAKPPDSAPTEHPVATPPETPILDVGTTEPTVEPPAEVPSIPAPVHVLLLGDNPRSFTNWTTMAWEHEPRIEWQAWYAQAVPEALVTHSRRQTALDRMPTAADVDGYDVLFLSALDPLRFPAEFWERVTQRVRDGRLGLLVVPDHAGGANLASDSSLRGVLPVAEVLPFRATTKSSGASPAVIPGVFDTGRPFAVTKEGLRHPASRFVSFPGWSERIWGRYTRGDHGWRTKFVSPVKSLTPGATVLVTVNAGDHEWPAFVASAPDQGRVLWLGGILDLDWDAYRTDAGYTHLRAMAISWIAWLSPPR